VKASELSASIRDMDVLKREAAILDAISGGNAMPCGSTQVGDIHVANDYIAVGEPGDWIRCPLSGPAALLAAKMLGGRLPTQAEVEAIYKAADHKLAAEPMGPPYTTAWARAEQHQRLVQAYLAKAGILEPDCGSVLLAGHKKDVLGVRKAIASDYLVRHGQRNVGDDVLAYFGFYRSNGVPWQHDDGAHEPLYSDYSHGVRVVIPATE
jgi:hypothetical protein